MDDALITVASLGILRAMHGRLTGASSLVHGKLGSARPYPPAIVMDYLDGNAASTNEYKLPQEELDTEFKKEFPPDPQLGREMDPSARVWKVYRKEATIVDNALLDGWSSTLNILLIFAGLFSAVATAFVIESYQQLQPDNAAYAAAALYILVAASNHSKALDLPPPPDLAYGSSVSRWINGLWFTSILLSLAVALLSILVLQWIGEYRSRNIASAASPQEWARRRESYFQALNSWPVAELVAFLPVLLHLSLFLFFAGTVAFLWSLDQAISAWVIVLGSLLGVFYLACTLIPLWKPTCPTATPLINQLRMLAIRGSLYVLGYVSQAEHALRRRFENPTIEEAHTLLPLSSDYRHDTWSSYLTQRVTRIYDRYRSQSSAFDVYRGSLCYDLDAAVIRRLILDVSDSDAVAVGLQSIGAVHPHSAIAHRLRNIIPYDMLLDETALTRSSIGRSPVEAARVLRSILCLRIEVYNNDIGSSARQRYPHLLDALADAEYPDMALLLAFLTSEGVPSSVLNNALAEFWCRISPSVTSTAMLLVRMEDCGLPVLLHLLSLCDLRQLEAEDWNTVVDLLSSHLYPDEPISFSAADCEPHFYTPLLVTHLLAQVATEYKDPSGRALAVQMIPRVLCLPSLERWWLTQPRLSTQGSLLRALSVDLVWEQSTHDDSLRERICSSWGAEVKYVSDPNTLSSITAALCQTLRATPTERRISSVHMFCLWAFDYHLDSWAPTLESTALCAKLDMFLCPMDPSGGVSIWTLMGATPFELESAIHLAVLISLHARRGLSASDTQKRVDAFFEPLEQYHISGVLRRFLLKWNHDTGSFYTLHLGIFTHFIRHCIELRSEWWDHFLTYMQENAGDREKAAVEVLKEDVERLGLCTKCYEEEYPYSESEL
ncbi:hypothetical protein EXIGLDRAFT_844596 [Exidia glandulosa HHB12029]|uniref:DUF6535 domain-containing protein n=1 Tax=Exidia glandulosa HHB12029 TaxID=1314781 RepID=A0A165ZCL7_EXIGL|nr:hypothetical protein EXIGLDRAFT_844596 [Exidia glandulosa HHB12029]